MRSLVRNRRWQSHERRQRLRVQDGHRERHGLGQRQQPAHAGDLSDGHPGHGEKHLPIEHPGAANVLRHSRQQGRVHGATPGDGSGRHAQSEYVREGRRSGKEGRVPPLRLVVAARAGPGPRRDHHPRHPLREDVRRELRGRSESHAASQYCVFGRAGRVSEHRHGGRRSDADREVLEEEGIARGKSSCDPAGFRLRQGALRVSAAVSSRSHGCHR